MVLGEGQPLGSRVVERPRTGGQYHKRYTAEHERVLIRTHVAESLRATIIGQQSAPPIPVAHDHLSAFDIDFADQPFIPVDQLVGSNDQTVLGSG